MTRRRLARAEVIALFTVIRDADAVGNVAIANVEPDQSVTGRRNRETYVPCPDRDDLLGRWDERPSPVLGNLWQHQRKRA